MTGKRRYRLLHYALSAAAVAAVYCLATTVSGIPANAAPHPHGGPHGAPHAFGHAGPIGHGGAHVMIHGGAHGHHGHWFGGRAGWIHGHRYFWTGLWFCWYPDGYNGPGWYVCGANM